VIFACDDGALKTHDRIRLANFDFGKPTVFGNADKKVIVTTVGRVRFSEIWPPELGFPNKSVKKSELGDLIWKCYKFAGHEKTVTMLDKLKELGFREATKSGASIGIDDMIVPKERDEQIDAAQKQIKEVEKQYRKGVITPGERYNKIVDIWTHCTDQISSVMFKTLEQNQGKKEYNPVYLMVDSGARGNKQQVRQLAGLRGLMAKPSGDIIEKPILANFREGLSVLEYFISTHGARKGLADTALKTADSGYMTRKLVDVSQDVIIQEADCGTTNGIWVSAVFEGEDEVVKLGDRLVGRFACDDIVNPTNPKEFLIRVNEEIDEDKAKRIEAAGIERVRIRSVLTCESKRGVCIHCYGRNLATGAPVKLGEAVGIIAAQSIGEPGTQLTMRTFHIGGTAAQVFKIPQIKAKHDGVIRYNELRYVELEDGNNIVLNKNGSVSVLGEKDRELENHTIVIGAVISFKDGSKIKKGETFVQWDPYNVPILSEKAGKVKFHDIIEGVTMKQEMDETTGQEAMVVIEHKEDLHPQITISDDSGEVVANYPIPSGAHIVVSQGDKIVAGTLMAKTPRKTSKTKDITGGLPRVAELFEARHPKDASEISRIDGIVDFGASVRGKRCIVIKDAQTQAEEEHLIPIGKHVIVFKGDFVKKGQQLTEGPMDPHEILDVCGPQELQEHLVGEVQEVYRLQGVTINDKHIEIIVRQMLRKVRITEPGDTQFLWGEQIDKLEFEEENERVEKKGGKPAEAAPVLLGITKASLETDSFLSAASFQDTTRVLTEAATRSKIDSLRGFKENVIMGHIIPAGTGFDMHRRARLKLLVDIPDEPEAGEPAEALAENPLLA
jgi:DNA-directed RNA polymerase subunit beta'